VTPTLLSFNADISACEKVEQWERTLSLFSELQELDMKPNATGFNASISTSAEHVEHEQLLPSSRKSRVGMTPDIISFNGAISACHKGEQWERVLSLFSDLEGMGMTPSVFSFNAGISACQKGELWERSLLLFSAIQEARMKPDMASCTAAIAACKKGHQWERALSLLRYLKKSRMTLDLVSFGAAMSGGGQWKRQVRLLRESQEAGITPNVTSFNAAISACEQDGVWRRASLQISSASMVPSRHVREESGGKERCHCSTTLKRLV